jgi:hypothetical protein
MTNTACMTAGCFTSSSTYKPMLYLDLALARLPFSFRRSTYPETDSCSGASLHTTSWDTMGQM